MRRLIYLIPYSLGPRVRREKILCWVEWKTESKEGKKGDEKFVKANTCLPIPRLRERQAQIEL